MQPSTLTRAEEHVVNAWQTYTAISYQRTNKHKQARSHKLDQEYTAMDRLCGLVVRVPVYTTEIYCVSCEVRTEFIYVM
jgi:hypothetical protein